MNVAGLRGVSSPWLLGLLVATLGWASPLFGVTYEPGPAPVVGAIGHRTWLGPDPRERTVIGPREWVNLEIESWEDTEFKCCRRH